MSFNFYN